MGRHDHIKNVKKNDSAVRQKLATALEDLVHHCAKAYYTATVTENWGEYSTTNSSGVTLPRYSILKGETVILTKSDRYTDNRQVHNRMAVQTTDRYTYPIKFSEFKKYFKPVETKIVYTESIRHTILGLTRSLKSIIPMPEVVVKN